MDTFALIDKVYAAALAPAQETAWRDLLLDLERCAPGARTLICLQDAYTDEVDVFEAEPVGQVLRLQLLGEHLLLIRRLRRGDDLALDLSFVSHL